MEYLINFINLLASITVIGFVLRSWINASMKHKYDLKMLEVESQKEMRLKGEVVAELLAEWIRKDGNLDYHQLNKLCFQAFIWLPKELAEELSDSLSHTKNSKDIRTLIKNIRTYLQGKDDGLKARDVIVFVKKTHYYPTCFTFQFCPPSAPCHVTRVLICAGTLEKGTGKIISQHRILSRAGRPYFYKIVRLSPVSDD